MASLLVVIALTGCGGGDGVVPMDGTSYFAQAADGSESWDAPPTKVDATGHRLDEPDSQGIYPGEPFVVLCALRVGASAHYLTEFSEPEGWNERTWEAWVQADGVQVRPRESGSLFGEAGAVPDDMAECDVDEPVTVTGPKAPDVHHEAFVVGYEEVLLFSVPETTFNGAGGSEADYVRLPQRAPIDVHCVKTTRNVVEEPPSTAYQEEVPYYLATWDGNTGYVEPLWVYFADDADVPAALDYDAQTGTVSDHGEVPALEECPN